MYTTYMYVLYLFVFSINMISYTATAKPILSDQAIGFLQRYGYLTSGELQSLQIDSADASDILFTALQLYQKHNGLPVTGLLDDVTQTLMRRRRCGVPDIQKDHNVPGILRDHNVTKRSRRFAASEKWPRTNLYYRFLNYCQDLSEEETVQTIERAFKLWSDVAPLTFTIDVTQSDIDILWATGDHGDAFPFDGAGSETENVLAHAFFPQYGGDLHFDEHEFFTIYSYSGVNLLYVAAHEVGHSLGLEHTDVPEALMYASYPGYIPDLQLHADDIAGIQYLYGDPQTVTNPTPVTTTATSDDYRLFFCAVGEVDAIARFGGYTYVFQGVLYARVDNSGIVAGYPRLIVDDWPGMSVVSAALDWSQDSSVFLFSPVFVSRYYMEGGSITLDEDYPKVIPVIFPGLPYDVHLAFQWAATLDTYFFQGDEYYLLNATSSGVASGYPQPVATWNLGDITPSAAYSSPDQRLYFFYDDQYILYNDIEHQPEETYPRSVRTYFFGCDFDEDDNDNDKDNAITQTRSTSDMVMLITWTWLLYAL